MNSLKRDSWESGEELGEDMSQSILKGDSEDEDSEKQCSEGSDDGNDWLCP